jgi:hypothetical protein
MPVPRRNPARTAAAAAVALAAATALIAVCAQTAAARELALAQGPIAIREAAAGQRAVGCGELVVEARDALDNHLIGRTHPDVAPDGSCRYALSVPAQSAVWLRVRAALVADTRLDAPGAALPPAPASASSEHRVSSRAVQLRFTVIAPTTSFFEPGEQKTIPLTY